MRNTNIIEMKDRIILKKSKEKKKLSENIANIIMLIEVTKVSCLLDLVKRYEYVISNVNINAANKLGLTHIKKY